MEQFWRISDFAKEIGKHMNTIDGWFKSLEEKNIHYVNRTENGEKIYDSLDLKIAHYIKQQREQKWALDIIFDSLSSQFDLRPAPKEEASVSTPHSVYSIDLEQFKREILSAAEEMAATHINEVKEQYEAIIQKLPQPKSPEQEREERLESMILRRRVEMKLEREAIDQWKQQPEELRFKKVGFFRKEEDWGKRDEFIRQYINERFEERVKESFK